MNCTAARQDGHKWSISAARIRRQGWSQQQHCNNGKWKYLESKQASHRMRTSRGSIISPLETVRLLYAEARQCDEVVSALVY
jgi:hypothetical protein